MVPGLIASDMRRFPELISKRCHIWERRGPFAYKIGESRPI